MSAKSIPIVEETPAGSPMRLPVPISGTIRFKDGHLIDERGRPLRRTKDSSDRGRTAAAQARLQFDCRLKEDAHDRGQIP